MGDNMKSAGGVASGCPIFISYRREDADGHARSLYSPLREWFGAEQVFYDQADLQSGDDFLPKLQEAVHAAQVIVAVIGPQWLGIINQRARAGTFDVVQFELMTALQQRRPVIPVFLGRAQPFGVHDLHDALRGDLGPLCGLDAFEFGQKQAQWDHDVRRLCVRLQAHVVPQPAVEDAMRMTVAQKAISDRLRKPVLEPLRRRWGPDPLQGDQSSEGLDLIRRFHTRLKESRDDWRALRLNDRDLEILKTECRHILSVLYGLLHDGSAARTWAGAPEVSSPLPVKYAGTAVFAYATAQNQQAVIALNTDDPMTFVPEHTVDLGEVDHGIGADRRAYVHKAFWEDVFPAPRSKKREYPHPGEPLSDDALNLLKYRLDERSEELQQANCLTDKVTKDGVPIPDDLLSVAAELGCVALPRTGKPGALLRADEGRVHSVVVLCLETIENLE